MNTHQLPSFGLLLALAACGSDSNLRGGGDAWWNVSTDQPWSGTEEGGEFDDEGEEDDEDEPFRIFWGELELSNGQPTAGVVGYFWTRGNDDVICDFDLPAEVTGPAECADCDWAVTVALGDLGDGLVDGDCSPYDGWASTSIEIALRNGEPGTRAQGETDWTFEGFTEAEPDFFFFEREFPPE